MSGLDALTRRENVDPWRRLDVYRWEQSSQNGEAGVIAYLLELFPEIPETCLEVGAGLPNESQNVFFLWRDRGWRALLIEGDAAKAARVREAATERPNITPYEGYIAADGEASLDAIAEKLGFPTDIGVVSIDIDSNDLEVFEKMRAIRASIAVIEFNHEIPADIEYRDPPGESFMRHSAKAVERVANEKGFRVVACVGPNAVLLREDLIDAERAPMLPQLPIEAMYDYVFARRRQFQTQLIRSKSTTCHPAYSRKPSFVERVYFTAYDWIMSVRALYVRGAVGARPVSRKSRAAARDSGFWA